MATATSTSFAPNNASTGRTHNRKPNIFYGGGKGNFTKTIVPGSEGLDFHEAKVVDLDGDGRPDIVSKPYNYGSPRIDIFMNQGPKGTGK
jgi:FG-GAP-like repeat